MSDIPVCIYDKKNSLMWRRLFRLPNAMYLGKKTQALVNVDIKVCRGFPTPASVPSEIPPSLGASQNGG